MSGKSSGRTIFFFCVWVFGCALALLVFPELLMRLMGIAPADTLIARIFGLVLLFISYYYLRAGLDGTYRRFYAWTVHARLLAMPAGALFVL